MSDDAKAYATPVLLKEVVATRQLGEVVVRGLRLSQRLGLNRAFREGDERQAADQFAARLLAASVVTKDGQPLFNEDEWDIFGAQHTDDTNALIDVAMRLGGFDRAEAKNA